jgi:LDH2 family malate/lactate/ureidoglycolate dehydrogenase
VAPYGGIDPILGTNPLAFGFPADPFPIIVDASTSAVSNAQVEMARLLGGALPPDVAVDRGGHVTADPLEAQAGALLPSALHKGYGLALAVQILGLMVGGDSVPAGLGNQGILLVVLDPEMFILREEFEVRLHELVARLKSSRPAGGVDEVLIPGEGRSKRRQQNRQRGILVPEQVLDLLKRL